MAKKKNERADARRRQLADWVRSDGGKTSLQLEGTKDGALPYPPHKEPYEIVGLVVGVWAPVKF